MVTTNHLTTLDSAPGKTLISRPLRGRQEIWRSSRVNCWASTVSYLTITSAGVADAEAIYSYEGTREMNILIVGKGDHAALSSRRGSVLGLHEEKEL